MRKPKHISHYLIITSLINEEPVSTKDSQMFYTARIENIITEFRDAGILFQEDAKAISKYSWYKPYLLVQTDMRTKYKSKKQDKNLQNAS
jgi:hypothetical protein